MIYNVVFISGVHQCESVLYIHIGIDVYTLLYIKQITNKDLLYSTGNSTQYSAMAYMGKESKKEWIYVYVLVLFYS